MDAADHTDDPLLDRELKGLPPPRAPQTLLPRVMAAVAEREERAPAATGWFTWPLSWRLASVALVACVGYGVWWLLSAPPAGVSQAARTAGETATVARVIWDVLLQPIATYIFILGVSLALVSAAAWAALEFALGEPSPRVRSS
jgi:hypothetical protein